jgi:hypothetical protein
MRERTLHDTAQGIKDGLGGKVLGGYEVYEVLLPPLLLQVELRVSEGRICHNCRRALSQRGDTVPSG